MIFTIILNRNCNLECLYCYQKIKQNIVMSDSTITKTCKFIQEKTLLSNEQTAKINISGGECLLYPEKLKNIITQLRNIETSENKLFEIEVSTNITLLTEDILIFFKKNKVFLFLSFDGIEKSHNINRKPLVKNLNSYEMCKKKLELIVKYNLDNVVLNSVIADNNLVYLLKSFKFFISKYPKYVFFYNIAYNCKSNCQMLWTEV